MDISCLKIVPVETVSKRHPRNNTMARLRDLTNKGAGNQRMNSINECRGFREH